jgi:hypothetical protein
MTAMNFDNVPKKMLNVDYLKFEKSGQAIYVMLNHRVAYLCWMDAYRKGIIKEGAFLTHIDKHLDFALHQNAILEEDRKIYCGNWGESKQILNKLSQCVKERLEIDIEKKVIDVFEKDATSQSTYSSMLE